MMELRKRTPSEATAYHQGYMAGVEEALRQMEFIIKKVRDCAEISSMIIEEMKK